MAVELGFHWLLQVLEDAVVTDDDHRQAEVTELRELLVQELGRALLRAML